MELPGQSYLDSEENKEDEIAHKEAPVSYTHLDVYKRQAHAAKAIHAAFHPDKLNYGAYGDTGCHLHMHLCPKYKDGFEWGGTFEMNPGKTLLTRCV